MFEPGKIVREFTTKNGRSAVIRYPTWEDATELLSFANEMVAEDTFVNMSGIEYTQEDEQAFLLDAMKKMQAGDKVLLFCFVDGEFTGNTRVERKDQRFLRSRHLGVFGIALRAEFRGEGIGRVLMETVIEESRKVIEGLRMIELNCFSTNTAGLALYEKLGFKECGRLPGGILHKGEYVDQVNMYLDLSNPV